MLFLRVLVRSLAPITSAAYAFPKDADRATRGGERLAAPITAGNRRRALGGISALTVLLLFPLSLSAQTPATFLLTPDCASGGVIAVGDFNGDGNLDIATTSGKLLLGNGDGTFHEGPTINFPGLPAAAPEALTAADVNHDGKLDLVAWGVSNVTVGVLFGNGDGTFKTAVNTIVGFNAPAGFGSEFAGDLGNGAVDLVLPNPVGNGVEVLIGNGDGTFKPPVAYLTGTIVSSVVLTDVNGDGKLDAVTAGNPDVVLLGNGDGTLGTALNAPISDFPCPRDPSNRCKTRKDNIGK